MRELTFDRLRVVLADSRKQMGDCAGKEIAARILGLPQKGSLRVGADADLVQFDENVEVSRVILGGIDVPMDID